MCKIKRKWGRRDFWLLYNSAAHNCGERAITLPKQLPCDLPAPSSFSSVFSLWLRIYLCCYLKLQKWHFLFHRIEMINDNTLSYLCYLKTLKRQNRNLNSLNLYLLNYRQLRYGRDLLCYVCYLCVCSFVVLCLFGKDKTGNLCFSYHESWCLSLIILFSCLTLLVLIQLLKQYFCVRHQFVFRKM